MNVDEDVLKASAANPDAFVKISPNAHEKWEARQEANDKRIEAEAQLHALDINSAISHRATIEGYLAAQVETNKEFNRISSLNMAMNERMVAALEKIAEKLQGPPPVTFVPIR